MRALQISAALLWGACSPIKGEDPDGPRDAGAAEDSGGDSEAPPRSLHSGRNSIEVGGLSREFILHLPDGLPVGAPLVVVLHGYSDSAQAISGYSGMDAVADREGFAVVYPQGMIDELGYSYWEVGYAFHDGSVDDVGFLLALRELLLADQGLDPDAVFVTGMSNGGDMSYRMACEGGGAIRAVAPVAGCLMSWLAESCAPSPEVPLLEIHGTLDRTTPWEGDPDGSDGYGPYLGTAESVGHFVLAYGLDVEETEALPDLDPADGSTVIAHRWSRAGSSTAVWLYEIDGGRHDWPDASGNQDIAAEEEIWSFFRRSLADAAAP